jgi:hypothetical protein
LIVIASEAKQSSLLRCGKKAGLLRRYAPRNDEKLGFAVHVSRQPAFKRGI